MSPHLLRILLGTLLGAALGKVVAQAPLTQTGAPTLLANSLHPTRAHVQRLFSPARNLHEV